MRPEEVPSSCIDFYENTMKMKCTVPMTRFFLRRLIFVLHLLHVLNGFILKINFEKAYDKIFPPANSRNERLF
jgi:hypothetical protein